MTYTYSCLVDCVKSDPSQIIHSWSANFYLVYYFDAIEDLGSNAKPMFPFMQIHILYYDHQCHHKSSCNLFQHNLYYKTSTFKLVNIKNPIPLLSEACRNCVLNCTLTCPLIEQMLSLKCDIIHSHPSPEAAPPPSPPPLNKKHRLTQKQGMIQAINKQWVL